MFDLKKLAKKFNVTISELHIRSDGRVEWICKHGIGHTIWYPKGSNAIHTCDNCCSKLKMTRN